MYLILRNSICKKHGGRGHGTSKISYQAVPYELFRKGFLIRRSQKNLCLFEPSFIGSYCQAEGQCQVFFSAGTDCLMDMFWKFGPSTG